MPKTRLDSYIMFPSGRCSLGASLTTEAEPTTETLDYFYHWVKKQLREPGAPARNNPLYFTCNGAEFTPLEEI